MKELEINTVDYSEEEVWLPILGYKDRYEISSNSIIRSYCCNYIPVLLLKIHVNKYGYNYLHLTDSYGVKKNMLLHRLVAITFIPNPNNLPQVNHINGIKTDNRVENLEWCTASENGKHAYRIGLSNSRWGSDNHMYRSKKCNKVIQQLDPVTNSVIAEFDSLLTATNYFKVSKGAISNSIRLNGKCKGYKWKHK